MLHNFIENSTFQNKGLLGRLQRASLHQPQGAAKSCVFCMIFMYIKSTFRNKGSGEMPSSRLDSHRNSVQVGMVEKITALTATIFVPNFSFHVAANFCPLYGNCKNDQQTKKLRKAGQVQATQSPSPDTTWNPATRGGCRKWLLGHRVGQRGKEGGFKKLSHPGEITLPP